VKQHEPSSRTGRIRHALQWVQQEEAPEVVSPSSYVRRDEEAAIEDEGMRSCVERQGQVPGPHEALSFEVKFFFPVPARFRRP